MIIFVANELRLSTIAGNFDTNNINTLKEDIAVASKNTLFQVKVHYVKKSDFNQIYNSLSERINKKMDDPMINDQPISQNCEYENIEKIIDEKVRREIDALASEFKRETNLMRNELEGEMFTHT